MRAPPSRKEISPKTSPGPGRLEHDALAGVVLEEDLDAALADDEQGAAGVVGVEDDLAGRDPHHVELPGEDLALLRVEVLEERYAGEQRRVGWHREVSCWLRPGEG